MFYLWFDDLSGLGTVGFAETEWRWCSVGPGPKVEGKGNLERIAALLTSQKDEVSLLLAARECVHLWLKVPPMSARNLRQALPFIAEEQVAQSVESMHFACGHRHGEQLNCLGISKALLRELLGLLFEYGISPVAAYSDASLLTARDGAIAILIDGVRCLVRTTRIAIEAPRQDLAMYLNATLHQMGEPSPEPHIEVFADEQFHMPAELADAGLEVTRKRLIQSPFAQLVSTPITEINLLVAEFEPQTTRRGEGRTWRLPLALAASLLAILVVSDLVVGWNALKQRESLQDSSLLLVDGLQTPEEVVRLIHREQGNRSQETRDFLNLLGQVSRVAVTRGASMRSLSYQSGSGAIDIEILVADYDALDGFSSDAQDIFRQADMLGATQTGDGVRARLRVVGAAQ